MKPSWEELQEGKKTLFCDASCSVSFWKLVSCSVSSWKLVNYLNFAQNLDLNIDDCLFYAHIFDSILILNS